MKILSPVAGSECDNIPRWSGCHLDSDPRSFKLDTPILYANCQSLNSGENPTLREKPHEREDTAALESPLSGLNKNQKFFQSVHGEKPKLNWAIGTGLEAEIRSIKGDNELQKIQVDSKNFLSTEGTKRDITQWKALFRFEKLKI